MIDPRDKTTASAEDVLTEDSEDELADLEKEFEVKKQKVLQERARRLERKKNSKQVERSPSPPSKEERGDAHGPGTAKKNQQEDSHTEDPTRPHNTIQRASRPAPSTGFADRLYASKSEETVSINYNDRFFEFENIPPTSVEKTTVDTEKDSISGEILSRRYFKSTQLDRLLYNVKVLRVPKLLAKIVPPKFEEPTYVNWSVTGIVMHKSDPKTAVNNKKYMALRVGNFHHTVDMMLFGDAFQKYWKVRVGDAIAVLNPTVKKFGNKFNLTILDDLNNLLELGTLKNYGHCSASTSQGHPCKNVVDKLKNDLCSIHEEAKYKQGSRMELQGSVKPKAPQNARGDVSELYMGSTRLFVQNSNNGFLEKDLVYCGGEQYDASKYDRAVESKSSRLRKERANASLEHRLLTTVAPRHLNDLAQLGIVKKTTTFTNQVDTAQKMRKRAFNSTFITGMGFDPTVINNKASGDNVNKLKQFQELRQLSQLKKISLEPSVEDRAKKRMQWKQALQAAKNDEHVSHKASALLAAKKSGPQQRHINVSSLDDSDIEITFTSDNDKLHYQANISGYEGS